MVDIAAEQQFPTPYANLSLFTALVMSVAQHKNCPDTATSAKDQYDFVIVGAGSAGSALAARLSEQACYKVLLLEAGDKPPYVTAIPATERGFIGTSIDYGYKTVPQTHMTEGINNKELVWAAGRVVGGSSVLNDVQYSRGNMKNYDSWAANGAPGWSYNEVLPYFKKLEDYKNDKYKNNGYHGVGGPITIEEAQYTPEYKGPLRKAVEEIGYPIVDPTGKTQTGFVFDLQGTLRNGELCSAPVGYLVPTENRNNLDILPNAMVTKILLEDPGWFSSNPKAIGVEYEYKGKTARVTATREVIVSAGTTHSPQLLMLSGIGPEKQLKNLGIPVKVNLPGVGENLQDHIGAIVNFETADNVPAIATKLTNETNVQEYIDKRTGVLASAQLVTVLAFLENGKVVSETDSPDHALYFLEAPAEIALQDFNLKPEVFKALFSKYAGKSTYSCFTHLLHPRSRGTVTLKSSDPHDPPLIDPNFFSNPDDIKDVAQGLKVCKKLGTHPAMKEVGSKMFDTMVPGCEDKAGDDDAYFACQATSIGASFFHSVGTSKMGSDPMAVVDPELRVRGVDNLRVVDASIMPTVPTGNTNPPTLMIAEKAADMIKNSNYLSWFQRWFYC